MKDKNSTLDQESESEPLRARHDSQSESVHWKPWRSDTQDILPKVKCDFWRCAIVLMIYAVVLASVSLLIVKLGLKDSLLFVFLIPCVITSFFCPRQVYLSLMALLLGAAIGVTSYVSRDFPTSLTTIAVSGISSVVIVEAIHSFVVGRERVQETLERQTEENRYMAEMGVALLNCDQADDVFEQLGIFLARILSDKASGESPHHIALVNQATPDQRSLVTRQVIGLNEKRLLQAENLVGFKVIGKVSPIVSKYRDLWFQNKLQKIPGGFSTLAASEIPKVVGQAAEKLLGLHDVFTIGIADKNPVASATKATGAITIYGNVHIITRRVEVSLPVHLIESLTYQCALTLSKINAIQDLAASKARYHGLFEHAISGFALHDIVLNDAGDPVDYIFREVNPAFERLTGLTADEILERRVTEVLPGIEASPFIEIYGRVAQTGEPIRFEQYSVPLGRYYDIAAYSLHRGQFVTLFTDITARVQSEQALWATKERLELAMDAGEHGFWDWNLDTDDIYFSPCYYTMLGYEPGELPMKRATWINLMHPEDRKTVLPRIHAHVENAEPYAVDFRLKCKDGSWKWISGRGKAYEQDADGIAHRAVGVHVDIDEHKRMAQTIQRQTEEQRILLDNIQTQVWYLTDAETYGAVNQAHSAFLGVDKADLEYKSLYEIVSREEAEICIAGNQQVFAQKKQIHTEEWVANGAGEPRLLSIVKTPALVASGEVAYVVCAAEDITERKHAEEAQRTRLRYEEGLANCSQVLLADKTPSENAPDALSQALQHLLEATGVSRVYIFENFADPEVEMTEAIGDADSLYMRQIAEACASGIMPQIDNSQLQRLSYQEASPRLMARLSQGQYFGGRVADLLPEERPILEAQDILSILVLPLQVAGTWYGYIGFDDCEQAREWRTEDIRLLRTAAEMIGNYIERQQTRQDLAHYTAALQRSNEDLQQFAYTVSHDLKAPLRMVKSFLNLLRRHMQGQLDAEGEEFLDFAVGGAVRMEKLIQALLEYTRIETQGQDPTPTDAEAVLHDVLHSLLVDIEERGAEVVHDSLPTVLVDATQLGQVFQNLIGNALKFCENTSPHIHVTAERQGDTDDEADMWVFSVQDNGIGIAPQYQARIFGVFERLHTDEEYEGTGIGLAICKRIVERHGGRMWVESDVGEGATFYFTLPVVE